MNICFIGEDDNNLIEQTTPTDATIPVSSEEGQCPLCQEKFLSNQMLKEHVVLAHSVNPKGLELLQSLMKEQPGLAENQLADMADGFTDISTTLKGTCER